MERKKVWWASKTIWINFIALIGAILVAAGLEPNRWMEISTVALAVINLILRFVTNEGIALHPEGKE